MSTTITTTTPTSTRRQVHFDHVSEIMPEVDRLLGGHRVLGQWSLGQICSHLALGFRYTVEGYPSRAPWLVRRTVGPLAFRWVVRTGRMPRGVPAPKSVRPQSGLDDRAEAEALRASIRFFEEYVGPIPEHPVFGRLSKNLVARLHCIHAAHHLAFVLPEPQPDLVAGKSASEGAG